MPRHKRSEGEADRQRPEIIRRYLMGETQEQIAESLGLSQQQISYDLREAKKQWKEQYNRDIQELIEEEIARLKLIESELWIGWNTSKQIKESTTHKSGTKGDMPSEETSVTRETSAGNPAFLNTLLNAIATRTEFMGLASEIKIRDVAAAIRILKSRGYHVFDPEVGDVAIALHSLVNSSIIPADSVDGILSAIKKSDGVMKEELRQVFNKSDRSSMGVMLEESHSD